MQIQPAGIFAFFYIFQKRKTRNKSKFATCLKNRDAFSHVSIMTAKKLVIRKQDKVNTSRLYLY